MQIQKTYFSGYSVQQIKFAKYGFKEFLWLAESIPKCDLWVDSIFFFQK